MVFSNLLRCRPAFMTRGLQNRFCYQKIKAGNAKIGMENGLYDSHIPSTQFQKLLLATGSAYYSLMQPWRDDMIATFGEVTGTVSLNYMKNNMQKDPIGLQILSERPRINTSTVDFEYLEKLPETTFGHHYASFCKMQGISPNTRKAVQFIDDEELAYVMQRYREVHDLLHTLLGMPTHMLGEVVVKWVEGIQFALPLGLAGGAFGAFRLKTKHWHLYKDSHLLWAIETGLHAKFLMNVYYEHHWEMPLDELRAFLNIKEPPWTPSKKIK